MKGNVSEGFSACRWSEPSDLHLSVRSLTRADSGVGDDGGVGPLVGAGDGVGALVHALQAAAVERHQTDAARHLRHRRAAGHRTWERKSGLTLESEGRRDDKVSQTQSVNDPSRCFPLLDQRYWGYASPITKSTIIDQFTASFRDFTLLLSLTLKHWIIF